MSFIATRFRYSLWSQGMAGIYQEIWNADQAHAGLKAIRPGTVIDAALVQHGYVVVNEEATGRYAASADSGGRHPAVDVSKSK